MQILCFPESLICVYLMYIVFMIYIMRTLIVKFSVISRLLGCISYYNAEFRLQVHVYAAILLINPKFRIKI